MGTDQAIQVHPPFATLLTLCHTSDRNCADCVLATLFAWQPLCNSSGQRRHPTWTWNLPWEVFELYRNMFCTIWEIQNSLFQEIFYVNGGIGAFSVLLETMSAPQLP